MSHMGLKVRISWPLLLPYQHYQVQYYIESAALNLRGESNNLLSLTHFHILSQHILKYLI